MSMNTSNHPRILVVEDDAAIRLLTANALRKAGFNVLEACTADEGAARISDANLDAIVTDVEMPGAMDGYDLAWRAHAACPTTPLFVISSSVGSDRRELPPHGRFFEKPLDPGILVAELKGALRLMKAKPARAPRSLQAVA
jgi:CheY-like chemotaxis protein